jgi:polyisoprenoid-binding protein YceI
MRSKALIIAPLLLAVSLAFAAVQWNMQPKDSQLTFTATQAGAPFEGRFDRFTADIQFDRADLASSRFDTERDETIRSADLFAVKQYPTARYIAERFTEKGQGRYAAEGKLTLRNVTKDVPIEFTFEENARGAWLKGSATIRRLDFGVGQGDWKDTSTVGNDVKVNFALLLAK